VERQVSVLDRETPRDVALGLLAPWAAVLGVLVALPASLARALTWLLLPAGLLALAGAKPEWGWYILLALLAAWVAPGLLAEVLQADSRAGSRELQHRFSVGRAKTR
jgi:hypothetical protein